MTKVPFKIQQENQLKQDNEVGFFEVLLLFCRQFILFDKILSWQENSKRNKELQIKEEKQRVYAEETSKAIYESAMKNAEMEQYRKLRKEIESTPQYKHWRNSVLEKFGRKCAVCGSIENIEVDHRYKSFYAIIRSHGVMNIIQAYECAALWDVNNGAPLCKAHHNQTSSSVYYLQKNQNKG